MADPTDETTQAQSPPASTPNEDLNTSKSEASTLPTGNTSDNPLPPTTTTSPQAQKSSRVLLTEDFLHLFEKRDVLSANEIENALANFIDQKQNAIFKSNKKFLRSLLKKNCDSSKRKDPSTKKTTKQYRLKIKVRTSDLFAKSKKISISSMDLRENFNAHQMETHERERAQSQNMLDKINEMTVADENCTPSDQDNESEETADLLDEEIFKEYQQDLSEAQPKSLLELLKDRLKIGDEDMIENDDDGFNDIQNVLKLGESKSSMSLTQIQSDKDTILEEVEEKDAEKAEEEAEKEANEKAEENKNLDKNEGGDEKNLQKSSPIDASLEHQRLLKSSLNRAALNNGFNQISQNELFKKDPGFIMDMARLSMDVIKSKIENDQSMVRYLDYIQGRTLLHWIAQKGTVEDLKYYKSLEGHNMDDKTYSGQNALHIAADYNNYEVLEELLLDMHSEAYIKDMDFEGKLPWQYMDMDELENYPTIKPQQELAHTPTKNKRGSIFGRMFG